MTTETKSVSDLARKPTIRQFATAKFGTLSDAIRSLQMEDVPKDIIDLHLDWSVGTNGSSSNDNNEREYFSYGHNNITDHYTLRNTKKQVADKHVCYVTVTIMIK
jgi:hypothetical protein